MPSFLYNDLTQLMPKVLEPRYETLFFENGTLIPTLVDLRPGAREVAYDRFSEYGDADLISDAATNIPIVDISVDEDRYPVYMAASGFPLSLQEMRAYEFRPRGTDTLNRFERRMSAARRVIAQRTNRFLALGYTSSMLNFPGFLGNALISIRGGAAFDFNTATFATMTDFLVACIESMTDNFVTAEPTQLLVPTNVRKKMLSTYNTNGTKTVFQAIAEQYPRLNIQKLKELTAASLDATVGTTGGRVAGRDRMMLYPRDPSVLNRHVEQNIAELAPEEFIRTDGMRRIYPMFSCFTPSIIDYPADCRYIDIVAVS
jgi:hypothetical protein